MHIVKLARGKRLLVLALAVVAAAGVSLVAVGSSAAADRQTVEIKQLTLTPENEIPPATANAIGYFSALLIREGSHAELDYDLSADGDVFTMAHIHLGAPGTNGPVVAFLYGPNEEGQKSIHPTGRIAPNDLIGPLKGDWAGFEDALAKGNLYVNVHSIKYPGGVLRVQLPATKFPSAPPTSTPAPPKTGTGISDSGSSSWSPMQMAGGALIGLAAGSVVLLFVSRRRNQA